MRHKLSINLSTTCTASRMPITESWAALTEGRLLNLAELPVSASIGQLHCPLSHYAFQCNSNNSNSKRSVHGLDGHTQRIAELLLLLLLLLLVLVLLVLLAHHPTPEDGGNLETMARVLWARGGVDGRSQLHRPP